MSLGAQLITSVPYRLSFLMKLQRKNSSCICCRGGTAPVGRGDVPEERWKSGSACLDVIAEDGPLHLKTSAACLCSLSPGSGAAEPGHGAPQLAWHGEGELPEPRPTLYGYHSRPLLPFPISSCTDTTAVGHISHCWTRQEEV